VEIEDGTELRVRVVISAGPREEHLQYPGI